MKHIQTGKLVHECNGRASLKLCAGALWLEVETAIGQHVRLRMTERHAIEVDGISYAVREARARPGDSTAAFRLVRL